MRLKGVSHHERLALKEILQTPLIVDGARRLSKLIIDIERLEELERDR
jgi:ribosome biogenesis SPOUT family RNA methylase Rps3